MQNKKDKDSNIKFSKNDSDDDIEKNSINANQENNHSKENLEEDSIKEEKLPHDYEEEISSLREEKLRLLAEMENLRKRMEKEKLDAIKFGSINLARDILSPNDNLTRALENIPKDSNGSEATNKLIEGLKMVQKEFMTILKQHGINKIDALNKKFDHNYHQAMFEIESKDHEEGIVTQEIQSGYTMHERLLRPSMVGVSKKPTKKPKNK